MFPMVVLICIAALYQSSIEPCTAVALPDDRTSSDSSKIVFSLANDDIEDADLEEGNGDIPETPPEEEIEDDDLDLINRDVRNKNFVRFGRSTTGSSNRDDKTTRFSRGQPGDNFIRLGRSTNFVRLGRGDMDPLPKATVTRSSGSNFIRLGRGKDSNFIRLGRVKNSNFIRLGRGKGSNFIRLGRGKNSNFIRLGRGKDNNFIRLGRGGKNGERDEAPAINEGSISLPRGGRPDSNFIRLGRGGYSSNSFVRLGRRDNFLRFGKADNFLRLGRSFGSAKPNTDPVFFGRGKLADRNFIRLGRSDPFNSADEHGFNDAMNIDADKTLPPSDGLAKRDPEMSVSPLDNMRFGRDLDHIEDTDETRHSSHNRSKRSADSEEVLTHDDEYENEEKTSMDDTIPFRYFYPLSAGIPNYVFAPELSALPPMHSKRGGGKNGNGNFIRFG